MLDWSFYQSLARDGIADQTPSDDTLLRVLSDPSLELLPLLTAAYDIRRHHCGRTVQVHILNNAQNGRCPEDCAYCTQARTSEADIQDYPLKSEEEILGEAERAYQAGAHRYCMVFAGRGPGDARTDLLAGLVRTIKSRYPTMEVCVSAGLLDDDKARRLKAAGLDRLNHNLNTSRSHYPSICTTHTYDDRLGTLRSARRAGLEVCSGLIAGMGEKPHELLEVARTLREVQSRSIPVNFLLPFEGNRLDRPQQLSPEYCLRVLCMFRLANPTAEVRCAAGREFHLRSMEALCLYPANSLFLDGYLNGRGAERRRTYQMIRDAGFEIESDHGLDELLGEIDADQPESRSGGDGSVDLTVAGDRPAIKTLQELRPART